MKREPGRHPAPVILNDAEAIPRHKQLSDKCSRKLGLPFYVEYECPWTSRFQLDAIVRFVLLAWPLNYKSRYANNEETIP